MRRRRAQHQDGFTLVEVMVALVIFGIAAAATTPLLV
ncbi:MAG: type II secretion system protein [Pseudorhodobacter sp.]|nr:type II secretion system protein [Frankiaceae bacterium]